MRRFIVFAALMAVALATACSPAVPTPTKAPPTAVPLSGKVSVAGSTTVQPLAEKLAEAFTAKNPGVQIDVQGGGTSVGIKSAGEGTVDIGTASREIADAEKQQYPDMKVFEIALDGIAIVVNPGVSVNGLTKDQAIGIFNGKITNWNQVGGPDKPIVVVSREEGSGTRTAFQDLVMGKDNPIVDSAILQASNGAIVTTVASTPYSVGYLSFGYLDKSVKALSMDGVEATVANALAKKYPVVRPLNVLTKGDPKGAAKAWIEFILSSEGQQMVLKEGYMAVK